MASPSFIRRSALPVGALRSVADGIPLYRDEHHLSVYGARLLKPLIEQVLSNSAPKKLGIDAGQTRT